MVELRISLDDLQQHIVKLGLDLYPTPTVKQDQIALQDLFDDLQSTYRQYFQSLTIDPLADVFNVHASFPADEGSVKIQTVSLHNRGLGFAIPLCFPEPFGSVHLKSNALDVYSEIIELLRKRRAIAVVIQG